MPESPWRRSANRTDTRFAAAENDYGTLVVFNPQPFAADEPVCVEFVYPPIRRRRPSGSPTATAMSAPAKLPPHATVNLFAPILRACSILPRTVYSRLQLQTGPLPAFGVKAFRLEKVSASKTAPENALLISKERAARSRTPISPLSVADNGTLTLTDKATGYVYRDLNYFIEEGDGGDAYIFNRGFPTVPSMTAATCTGTSSSFRTARSRLPPFEVGVGAAV